MAKVINTSGKRKTAIARATLREGRGVIRINSVPLESYGTDLTRMKISEPLLLYPAGVDGIDVSITVIGGGIMGQAEAVRTALALLAEVHEDVGSRARDDRLLRVDDRKLFACERALRDR